MAISYDNRQEKKHTMKTPLKTLAAWTVAAGAAFATLAAQAHEFKVGNIRIGHPYARATTPAQKNGGAYLSLENAGADDKLMSADAATVAGSTEIHQMAMEGDVMRMHRVDSVALPKGKPVVLKPGAYHVMLVDLKAPLKEGDKFPMTLKFEKAGEVTVMVNVEKPGADHSGDEVHKH
jgi:copper(I)-binding protein